MAGETTAPCSRDAHTPPRPRFQRLFASMLEATESQALAEICRRTLQKRARFLATPRI
ncbi:hypothetical protein K8O61_14015 [Xanthomonas cerealis pv. cerealis]|uniref:hypothetical protein n=1 Tax=Xanthomonas translucens group TaxID=3390202 RepID=UPI001E62D546|nr:hypothetical protein [Xanthomonas translucens]UKE68593.1 hypothetical protein K8O61_14015 [Xanthomonas translucens pv. pistacia]